MKFAILISVPLKSNLIPQTVVAILINIHMTFCKIYYVRLIFVFAISNCVRLNGIAIETAAHQQRALL